VKILFSAAFATEANVGISLYIRNLIPELARLCELTVLSPDAHLFSDIARTIGIPAWTRSHLGRVAWTTSVLPRFCSTHFDAVLCPTPVAPVAARIPVVAVVHDLTPLMLPRSHPAELKAVFWFALQTLRRAAAIVTDSEHTRTDLTTHFRVLPSRRVHVVPAGPGIRPHGGGSSYSARFSPYILYVGGHARHKNLPRLVAAFARLHCSSSLRLIIAGWSKPELIARTLNAIRLHGLEERVVIISDCLTEAELSSLYTGCAAFVYASLYEGFGLPVLEAMAHGAPVACSRRSSLPEVGGDAVLYFDPMSADSIADKLQTIVDNAELAGRLHREGPLRATRFSWAKTASSILQVLESAACGHQDR
jgi:glycosyltransferase involved in cell wall biosynthesis